MHITCQAWCGIDPEADQLVSCLFNLFQFVVLFDELVSVYAGFARNQIWMTGLLVFVLCSCCLNAQEQWLQSSGFLLQSSGFRALASEQLHVG